MVWKCIFYNQIKSFAFWFQTIQYSTDALPLKATDPQKTLLLQFEIDNEKETEYVIKEVVETRSDEERGQAMKNESLTQAYQNLKDRISSSSTKEQLFKILFEIQTRKISIDVVLATCFIERLFDLRLPFAAVEMFRQLTCKCAVKPDHIMWVKFVLRLGSFFGFEFKALQFFHQMLNAGITPPEKVFTKMINSLAARGSLYLDKSIELFEIMKKQNILFTCITLNTMMLAYWKAQKPFKALHLFEEMKDNVGPLNHFTYSILLRIYDDINQLDKVETIIATIKAQKALHHPNVINTVFSFFAKRKRFREAIEFHDWILSQNIPLDQKHHETILSVYADCSPLEETEKRFNFIIQNYPTSFVAYEVMMKAYNQHCLWNKTLTLQQQMKERGLFLGHFSFYYSIEACKELNDSKTFWRLVDELFIFKKLNSTLTNHIIRVAVHFKDSDNLKQLFEKLHRHKAPLSLASFSCYVQAVCGDRRRPLREVLPYWPQIRAYYHYYIDNAIFLTSVQEFTTFFATKLLPAQLEKERRQWQTKAKQIALTQEDRHQFFLFLDKCFHYVVSCESEFDNTLHVGHHR
jgi:pentatricopeptide repeat protein